MGRLEDDILESMIALRLTDPEIDRHMVVFPVRLMTNLGYLDRSYNTDRAGEVVVVRREEMLDRPGSDQCGDDGR